jgi:hypothetical protein
MAVCEVCGNDYARAFEVTTAGATHVFDSFECAIHRLAPACAHCGCRVIGHGGSKTTITTRPQGTTPFHRSGPERRCPWVQGKGRRSDRHEPAVAGMTVRVPSIPTWRWPGMSQ